MGYYPIRLSKCLQTVTRKDKAEAFPRETRESAFEISKHSHLTKSDSVRWLCFEI